MFFESPTNPVTKVADIAAITRLARAHGALTVLDNTFAGFHQHGEYDIDLYLHSLTKYAAGTGDVMGGIAIGSSAVIQRIRADWHLFGAQLDPHAAFLLLRGMKTYFLRYRAQCAAAQEIANFLAAHPAVERVRYPGLASHPQAALARRQMREFGSIVTFDMRAGAEAGRRFAEALRLFAVAASLGSTESLVLPPQMIRAREFTSAQAEWSDIRAGTVRLSIGLEDLDDLRADLGQAFEAAAAAHRRPERDALGDSRRGGWTTRGAAWSLVAGRTSAHGLHTSQTVSGTTRRRFGRCASRCARRRRGRRRQRTGQSATGAARARRCPGDRRAETGGARGWRASCASATALRPGRTARGAVRGAGTRT